VAAVGQEPRGTGCDRSFADGRRFREHPLGVDLVAPIPRLPDAPADRRERDAVDRTHLSGSQTAYAGDPPADQSAEINLLVNGCPNRLSSCGSGPPASKTPPWWPTWSPCATRWSHVTLCCCATGGAWRTNTRRRCARSTCATARRSHSSAWHTSRGLVPGVSASG